MGRLTPSCILDPAATTPPRWRLVVDQPFWSLACHSWFGGPGAVLPALARAMLPLRRRQRATRRLPYAPSLPELYNACLPSPPPF